MRNKITTEELIKQRFLKEEADKILDEAKQEIEEIKWGGARKGAGRKPKTGNVLEFQIRVSKKEKEFIPR